MTDSFWPDAKTSIVLLPSGPQGESLLALAAEWTKMGMLGPALWVQPERFVPEAGAPPHIDAMVLGVGRDQEIATVHIDLFEALAQEALAVVRLVKLRSAVPSRALDAEQDAIAERVRDYVRRSMPMPNPAANISEQATDLKHVTLICAPTEFQLQQRVDWTSGEYGVVVVASPEDRSSPWSGDAFVRENERFVGFTLLHLASVAGLWNGVGKGSFELSQREESGSQSVWVSRVFLNAVLTESLGRRTAARVLDDAARPDSLLVDASLSAPPVGTAFIDDAMVSGYVDDMVTGAMRLDDGTLGFRASRELGEPSKRRVAVFAQIGRFFSFSWDKLSRMPYWSWRWLTSRTSRRLTRSLHSDEGAEIVGYDLDWIFDVRDRSLIAEARHIKDSEQAARAHLNAPASKAHIRTTPQLWAGLRELVFGALDGSADLSDLGFAPIEGNVPIFGRVSDVLALPGEPWRVPREKLPPEFPEKVDWYALALDDPREKLEDHVQDAADRRAENEAAVAAQTAAVEAAKAKLPPEPEAPDGPPTPDTEPENSAPPTSKEAKRLAAAQIELEKVQFEFYRADADLEARTQTLENYDSWAATQDRSFIWGLLHRLAEERRSAERIVENYSDEIERTEVPAAGELMRLRKRFHRTMLIGWFVAIALAGLLLWHAIDTEWRGDPRWWYAGFGIIAVAALLLTYFALVGYHSGWSRFQRRVDVMQSRLEEVGRYSRHARQEAARLRSIHRQAVDWMVLLSKAIHRPWHVPAAWMERQGYEVARGALPFAVQIATIQDDDRAATERMRAAMTDQLIVRGWRHAAFESLVAELALLRGTQSGSFGIDALDEDLPHSSNHTRTMLLHGLDDDEALTRVAGPRLEQLVKESQLNYLNSMKPRVKPVGENPLRVLLKAGDPFDSGAGEVPWDDFLLGSLIGRRDPITPISATVLAELEVGERHHERVASYLVLPQRLVSRLDFQPEAAVTLVPFADGGSAPVDLVWRVDIAGPMPRAAIHLWSERHSSEAPSATPVSGTADTGV